MNKKHKILTCIACPAIACFVLYQAHCYLHSEGMSKEEFYLQENIEALSDAENSSASAKCGTKEEFVEEYPCPVHPYRMIGFRRTEYSYAPIGRVFKIVSKKRLMKNINFSGIKSLIVCAL